MTVKCIAKHTQLVIVGSFEHGVSLDTLAKHYGRSRRTIIRVLEDHGVDPKIHRRPGRSKPKAMPTEQTTLQLQQATRQLTQVEHVLEPGATEWKTRPKPVFPRDMPEPITEFKHNATRHFSSSCDFPGYPVHPLLIPTPDHHAHDKPWYQGALNKLVNALASLKRQFAA